MPFELPKLTTAEVAPVKKWIDDGAQWENTGVAATATAVVDGRADSARKPRNHARRSATTGRSSCRCRRRCPMSANPDLTHPIDRFLEKVRADKGLVAAPRADRRALIRRAYLDLIGLPPTPAQVKAFVDDKSHDAWEQGDR